MQLTKRLDLKVQTPTPAALRRDVKLPWEVDVPSDQQLTILNRGDLKLDTLLQALGICNNPLTPSFGLSSKGKGELKERNDLCAFFKRNKRLLRSALNAISLNSHVPLDYNRFIEYNVSTKQHNPYWEQVHALLDALEQTKGPVPARVQKFIKWLHDTMEMEAVESEMSRIAIETMSKIIVMEGIMTFSVVGVRSNIEIAMKEEQSWGYQQYGERYGGRQAKPYSPWTDKGWGKNPLTAWVARRAKKKIDAENLELVEQALHARTLTAAPEILQFEIASYLRGRISSLSWWTLQEKLGKLGIVGHIDNVEVTIHYTYSPQDGLEIRIRYLTTADLHSKSITFKFDEFRGFNDEQQQAILDAKRHLEERVSQQSNASAGPLLMGEISRDVPSFFAESAKATSKDTDYAFNRNVIDILWEQTGLGTTLKSCGRHREKFYAITNNLRNVQALLDALETTAKKSGFKLNLPDIVWNGTDPKIAFKEIYPIQLLGRISPTELVPITGLPAITGNTIGFTGQHGEGKTTILETILAYIYLAQSGMPIFGEGLSMVLYDTLGAIFLERGSGSTCELIVEKVKTLIKHLMAKPSNAFLAIDELGAGTQEAAGEEFGRKVLLTLEELHASVVFSTQITSLAQFMQDTRGVHIFQVNEDHEIQPGIGTGKLDVLIQQSGLGDLLAK